MGQGVLPPASGTPPPACPGSYSNTVARRGDVRGTAVNGRRLVFPSLPGLCSDAARLSVYTPEAPGASMLTGTGGLSAATVGSASTRSEGAPGPRGGGAAGSGGSGGAVGSGGGGGAVGSGGGGGAAALRGGGSGDPGFGGKGVRSGREPLCGEGASPHSAGGTAGEHSGEPADPGKLARVLLDADRSARLSPACLGAWVGSNPSRASDTN
mmetsp:Transcript_127931/g.292276  ORF Transcript_127931/g.292276 Transcript_127931/m.292276 type:complete len:211 (+) Transcript_127931:313-945(+)